MLDMADPASPDPAMCGWAITEGRGDQCRVNGDSTRDEAEQVTHVGDLLGLVDHEGLDAAFWPTFASYELTHRADPSPPRPRQGRRSRCWTGNAAAPVPTWPGT
jgi:hypothetical protein